MRHYCLGGCSAPSVCARRSRPVRGARAGTWCCVSPVSPFLPRASWHWELVGPFHMVRASPRVLPRSLAPSGVLGGERSGPGSPLLCLGLSGAPPPPTARPLGGLLGSITHVLWSPTCGCEGPTLSPWPARPVGAACPGGGGGLSLGGVACRCREGRLVSGAVPPPAVRPLGRGAGVPRPVCSRCGQCGRGDPAPVPQRAPLRAGVARCGGGGRASPGGVPSTVVMGV